ncbi:putative ribonuclease H-like domain-containing protein, partial [Tanacetum coccineum]
DQPNVAGTGPNWMFDLDFLTNSINYIPVSIENQVIVDAGTQDSYVAGSSRKDKGPTQEYILLPLQPYRTRIPVKDVVQDAQEQPSENVSPDKVLANAMNDESRQAFEEEKRRIAAQATSTNQLSTDSQIVSTGRPFISTDRSNIPNVSAASTFIGANADESSFVYLRGKIPIDASTLPNADLLIDLNMPDLEDASNTLPNDGIFNGAYDDDKDVGAVADFNNMDNTIAVNPIPTLRIHKDHPKGQILGYPTSAVQTRGKIQKASSAQQALLVEQCKRNCSVHVTEGISCLSMDVKVLSLWNKLKKGLLELVYVDDIIFGSTKKSICTEFEEVMHKRFQISSMGELTFFLGLQGKQLYLLGFFISQDKYVADILKKFDFCSIKIATTPIESQKPLVKDEDGVEILLDISNNKPKTARVWYSYGSPFELEAFSDSDYAGASLDRKSTTGGCQFLGRRLISWQCKKQTIMANSTTEAEYVAAAHCCGQNPVYHSRTKHIEIRHHFIRDCYEKRLIDVLKIHTDSNVADLLTKGFDVTRYALTHNPTIYDSLVKQFWKTATVRTLANGTQQLVASIDSKKYTIAGASVRSKLQLADTIGIHNLSDANIICWICPLGDIVPLLPAMLAGAAVDQDKGSSQLAEPHHILLVTRINNLETELKDTKQILGNAVLTLVKKVKSLETALKRKSKKESMKEKSTDFITPTKASREAQEEEISPTILEVAKTLSKVASQGVGKEKSTDKGKRYRRRARFMAKKIDIGLDDEEKINTDR